MRPLTRVRRLAAVSAGACLAALGAAFAHGEPSVPRSGGGALSVGSPTDGALVGGVMLRETAALRLRWPEGPRWALPELVSALERAAHRVDKRFPGSVLLVGDLSRQGGGSLAGHVSHASGRDADVGFYYADLEGRVVRTPRLVPVRPTGSVADAPSLRFDEPRNWALIESLLTDDAAIIQKIFIADALRQRLLDYGRHHGARGDVLERATFALRQPGRGAPHDDHFHVRIACPRGTQGLCVSEPEGPRSHLERTAALDPASPR